VDEPGFGFTGLPTGARQRPPVPGSRGPDWVSGETGKSGTAIIGLSPKFDEGYRGFEAWSPGESLPVL